MFSGSIWRNPSSLSCWEMCPSCFRCANKGKYAACGRCSGRHDTEGIRDPYDIDDQCRCKEGILQLRTKQGVMIQRQFYSDPFGGSVVTDAETDDERQWNQFVTERREALNDPTFDPVRFDDGSSTLDWFKENRG